MTTAADVVVEALADAGVDKVFGVVGTSTLDVADAIARDPRLEFVSARAEEAAAHMADGYARAAGRVGVVLAHVGPGALRQLYGIGTAWKDSVPLLALTGNEMLHMTDAQLREGYHVVDVLELYRPVTKATFQLRRGDDARTVVARALWLATSGRPGPVLLDLPKSSLKQPIEASPAAVRAAAGDRAPAYRPPPPAGEVEAAAAALRAAARPVLYAGGGVHWSGASSALTAFAELANLPVLTTDGGRGAIPEDHPLALGVIARQAGDGVARALLAEADVILALGTPFSDVSTFEWSAWSTGARVFQVDVAPEAAHKGATAERVVIADAREFITALSRELTALSDAHNGGNPGYRFRGDWDERRAALDAERARYLSEGEHTDGGGRGVNPWRLIAALTRHLPRDAFISVDSGMHSFFGKKLRVLEPRTYIRSAGFGAMGYSFPALLGAVEAAPGRRAVAIVGDGCLAMCLGEFETAARRGAPVTVVVLNDSAFASQLSHQQRRFDGRLTGTRFGTSDFAKVAEAQGVPGWTVTTDTEAEAAIAAAVTGDGPNIIDARVDSRVTPPTWIEGSGDARTAAMTAGGRP